MIQFLLLFHIRKYLTKRNFVLQLILIILFLFLVFFLIDFRCLIYSFNVI